MKNKDELNGYLKEFVISKEVFNFDVNDEDIIILKKYYKDSCDKASSLVIDGELVGITFDNLSRIKKLIKIHEKIN